MAQNTPLARAILKAAAQTDNIDEMRASIWRALRHMHRRPLSHPRAPVTSNKVTDDIKNAVIMRKKFHPEQSHQQIADDFGINIGRVSEILSQNTDV